MSYTIVARLARVPGTSALRQPCCTLACGLLDGLAYLDASERPRMQPVLRPPLNSFVHQQEITHGPFDPQLERATQLPSSAEAVAGRRGDRDAAAHLGHLAEQTAKLALQRSRAAAAEGRVAAAQGGRDQVPLQAREAAIDRARLAAPAAQSENQRLSRGLADLHSRPGDRGTVHTRGGYALFATGRSGLKAGAERMIGQLQRLLQKYGSVASGRRASQTAPGRTGST